MTGQYYIDIEHGDAFNMSSGRIGKSVRAVLKFEGDAKTIARRGPLYFKGDEPKNIKLALARTRISYQRYYDRTGQRWEIEQREKADAARAVEKAKKEAAKLVREAAPELADALKIARRVVAKAVKDGKEPENVLRTIDAALAKAGLS